MAENAEIDNLDWTRKNRAILVGTIIAAAVLSVWVWKTGTNAGQGGILMVIGGGDLLRWKLRKPKDPINYGLGALCMTLGVILLIGTAITERWGR